jgi:hypothetical protein
MIQGEEFPDDFRRERKRSYTCLFLTDIVYMGECRITRWSTGRQMSNNKAIESSHILG